MYPTSFTRPFGNASAPSASPVVEILRTFVPTPAELAGRRRFVRKALRLTVRKPASTVPFPSTEEMLREDHAL
jgi:hypothetical protein